MSKGLGKVQTQILDLLKTKDRPLCAQDIAYDLYEPQRVRENDPTPHSFYVSVRRAIHNLEARGLVLCGEENSHLYGAPTRALVCWMPGQAGARLKPILNGALVEQAIIVTLQAAEQIIDEKERYILRGDGSYNLRSIPFSNDKEMLRYEWLTSQVYKWLYHKGYQDDRTIRVAITRAVYRLKTRGIVKIRWKKAGVNGWISLQEAKISVAL